MTLTKHITSDTILYLKNGQFHREDGPAFVRISGEKSYYIDGRWMFSIFPDGTFSVRGFPIEDESSNNDLLVLRQYSNGLREHIKNGKLHRTDGPAVECVRGTTCYYVNGKWLFTIFRDGSFETFFWHSDEIFLVDAQENS